MGKQVAAGLKWGLSSVGRAPALQAGGREFESLYLHSDSVTDIFKAIQCTLKISHGREMFI